MLSILIVCIGCWFLVKQALDISNRDDTFFKNYAWSSPTTTTLDSSLGQE